MKLFPSPNNLWARNTSCFCSSYFGTSFKPERECDDWIMFDLQRKRNAWILLCSEKAVEIPENKAAFVPDINDHAVAGLYWLGS